jgi:Na+/proline symporter
MTDPNFKRRWYQFSLQGMLTDCQLFIRFATITSTTDPASKSRRFQFSLRGMLLVVSLFALSFGLIKKGSPLDSATDFLWLFAGLNVFAGTIGAAFERLCNPRRRGTVGAIVASIPVWLLGAFMYLLFCEFEVLGRLP